LFTESILILGLYKSFQESVSLLTHRFSREMSRVIFSQRDKLRHDKSKLSNVLGEDELDVIVGEGVEVEEDLLDLKETNDSITK